jgi:integrase
MHNEKVCKVSINRTKGEKERIIHIPLRLMDDLWLYINELRYQQQQQSGTKTNHLFLNTNDNNAWIYGSNGLNKALNDLKLPFKVTPHKLRHTYACHMLKGLMTQKNTKFEPLMYLQRRLGHSSITTTMIYLDIVNDMMDELTLEYQEQINNICDTGDIA